VRAVVQRVSGASVTVQDSVTGSIERGLLVYLGVAAGDKESDAAYLAEKVAGLRIFNDENGTMNLSLAEVGGGVLVVSQFTLLADARKGRRPSYSDAASNDVALKLYEEFIAALRAKGLETACGVFRASMRVAYVNEGPITILLDSKKLF